MCFTTNHLLYEKKSFNHCGSRSAVCAIGRIYATPSAFGFRKGMPCCKRRSKRYFEGGVKDVVFVLDGHKENYYINRGLEQGLTIDDLKQQLKGKEVTIKYPNYWSILDPSKSIRHIAKVEFEGKTIFSEVE